MELIYNWITSELNKAVIFLVFTSLIYKSTEQAYGDTFYSEDIGDSRNEAEAPYFKYTQRNITASPGSKVKLRCIVENLGTKTVVFRKKGEPYPLTIGLFTYVGDERITPDLNQRTREWILRISDVKPADEGTYLCSISTKEHKDKVYEINLTVKTVKVAAISPTFIEKGNLIHLVCNASGKPEPPRDVQWLKDGVTILSDAEKGRMISKRIESKMLISTLIIHNCQLEDAGVYFCVSSNNDIDNVTIHILDIETSNVKRGTSYEDDKGQVMNIVGGRAPSSKTSKSLTLLLTLTTTFVISIFHDLPVR